MKGKLRKLLAAFILGLGLRKPIHESVGTRTEVVIDATPDLIVWEEEEMSLPEAVAMSFSKQFNPLRASHI